MQTRRSRVGFTLIEMLVVIGIIGVLLGLLLPAVQQVRASARRTQCTNGLRQLSLALHQYHDVHKLLPSGALVVGPAFGNASGWGWGAMILPFVEENSLYERIDFNVGTAVGGNIDVISVPVSVWRCPADVGPVSIDIPVADSGPFRTAHGNYAANHQMMSGMTSQTFATVTDGLSNTVLLGERGWSLDPDARPLTSAWCGIIATQSRHVFDSIPFLEMTSDRPVNFAIGGVDCFSSHHSGGAHLALSDGSVRLFSESMDSEIYEALGTPAGGDSVAF